MSEVEPGEKPWIVAVFAHNEAAHIVACLESIARASQSHVVRAFVLANGCRDNTEAVVRDFAAKHPWVSLVSIQLGDKSNAWNVFVHDIAPPAEICFFVDGDVLVAPGSFDELFAALHGAPEANAAAAVPSTGRSQRMMEELVCKHRLLLGNLYALRGDLIQHARQVGARCPIGYIGEDGLVTSFVKWDLDPQGPFIHERVAPCPAARFAFRSFSLWVPKDWRTYWRRRVRYSLRHFQHELLVPQLTAHGLPGAPSSVIELYQQQALRLQGFRPRSGVDMIFDRIALRQMRQALSAVTTS